jgi:hypothetical protein
VGDLQKMQEILHFEPTYPAEDSLRKFAEQNRGKQYVPEAISRAYDVDLLKRIIERRQKSDPTVDDPQVNILKENEGDDNE